MRLNDILSMSIGNLWRRKTRTFLTTLGVIIGSSSILLMVSMGIGYEKSFEEQNKMFGNTRIIQVSKGYGFGGAPSASSAKKKDAIKLNDDLVKVLKGMDHVEEVLSVYMKSAQITTGRNEQYAQLIGLDLTKLDKFQFKIEAGELPEPGEKALIVGQEFEKSFSPTNSRSYETIKIDPFKESYRFYIDSMYRHDGQKKRPVRVHVAAKLAKSGEYDYAVIMDRDTLLKLIVDDERRNSGKKPTRPSEREYDSISVLVDDINHVEGLQQAIKDMGLTAFSPIEYINQQKKQIQMVQGLLGGIGLVSLLVAAIGITNTMIMSIYERTREIGIIKVLGAEVNDILKMFLVEAATIGFIGGVIGVFVSFAASQVINSLIGSSGSSGGDMLNMGGKISQSIIPLNLALLSVVFATLIGLLAGMFPAMRATKLSALEAIKNE